MWYAGNVADHVSLSSASTSAGGSSPDRRQRSSQSAASVQDSPDGPGMPSAASSSSGRYGRSLIVGAAFIPSSWCGWIGNRGGVMALLPFILWWAGPGLLALAVTWLRFRPWLAALL